MHNQKQNKVPLKKDGLDLDRVYGRGRDARQAEAEGKDVVYWWPGALGHLSPDVGGESYIIFDRKDWDGLKGQGKVVSKL